MAQWLSGVVKEVHSGDTIVITDGSRHPTGQLVERRLNLASLSAPRMPRRDGISRSEELAWESREFMRKLAIGRRCKYQVDYKVDQIDREFGTVRVERGDGEYDLSREAVAAGWCRVRSGGDPSMESPNLTTLQATQEASIAAGLGVHSADGEDRDASVFSFDTESAAIGADFLATVGRGVPVRAIVDLVLTGSTMKVVTVPSRIVATFVLAGAKSPMVRRNSDGGFETDPFGLEAKAFTELAVLNREVRLILHGDDKGSVYGELVFPGESKPRSLAAALLEHGMAKYVEWSARALPTNHNLTLVGASQLKALEVAAQGESRGMWAVYSASAADVTKADAFAAKVVEVVSGDTVVVRSNTSGKDLRVSLASLRAPRMRPGGASEPEAYAREAKEFVRKTCIGKDVSVVVEFTRKIPPALDAPPGTEATTIQMCNVEVKTPSGVQELAEMLVKRGLAAVQAGRETERSSIFALLTSAEEEAKSRRLHLHSPEAPPPARINDVSASGHAAAAKQYLPFFMRGGRVTCAVEHVMSGSRLKLHVPSSHVTIAFSPSGVKTPSRGAPARGALPAVKQEPFGEEAYQLVRDTFLQRDAEMVVESVDRMGTFLGRLSIGKTDLSIMLLSSGFGSLHPAFNPDRVPNAQLLVSTQAAAQAARRGVWHDYVEPAPEDPAADDAAAAEPAGVAALRRVTVTHVSSGTCLHVQPVDDAGVAWVAEECAASAAAPFDGWDNPTGPSLRSGLKVLAQFSVDGLWYRGTVQAVEKGGEGARCHVLFMDYGNSEWLPEEKLRPIPAALAAESPYVRTVSLAFVRVPDLDDAEWGEAALAALSAVAGDGQVFREQVVRAGTKAWGGAGAAGAAVGGAVPQPVVLYPDGEEELLASVNAQMLREGYARLPGWRSQRSAAIRTAVQKLQAAKDVAMRAHVGMYQHGDPGDSDDDV